MSKRVYSQCFAAVNAIIERDDKFLFVKLGPEKDVWKDTWTIPGGWIENENDNPISAVKREVREETGVEFRPKGIVGILSNERQDLKKFIGETPHGIIIFFHGIAEGDIKPIKSGEIDEVKWLKLEEIKKRNLRYKAILTILDRYVKGDRYPLSMIHHRVQK